MLGRDESLDSKSSSANEYVPGRCGTRNHPEIAKEPRPGSSDNPLDQVPAHALPITISAGYGSDPISLSKPDTLVCQLLRTLTVFMVIALRMRHSGLRGSSQGV